MSTCVLLLRYQPTKTNLIELLPQSIRSACVTPNKEIPPSFVQQQHYPPPPSFVCPSTTTTAATITSMNQMSRQQCYSKKIYESSDSGGGDDYDPNWSRQGSKDDEFLVPGTAGLQYGSVPYQHGGSSSRR